MNISYIELLSPDPIQIPGIGGVISPTLRSISSIGQGIYQLYLSILLADLKTYLRMLGTEELYSSLPEEKVDQTDMFELWISDEKHCMLLQEALNFFIKEDVGFSPTNNCFIITSNKDTIGFVAKDTYPQLCSLICQRNCLRQDTRENLSKAKNKKALEIIKKLQKGRADRAKHTKADADMELGNIISAVANKSQSLNILNIWDLTIFQLWDCFQRLSNNSLYDIQSMSVATWGNKDNYFDAAAWYKRLNTDS